MQERFKDIEHLLRLVFLFAIGILLFVVVRAAMVPEGFGQLGHYRPASLTDNMEQDLVFAGRQACAECHDDAAETKASGAHAGVGCEACHGALARHTQDPTTVAPERPEPSALCAVCHRENAAKPSGFPQVDAAEHSGGDSCGECHEPHSPGFE